MNEERTTTKKECKKKKQSNKTEGSETSTVKYGKVKTHTFVKTYVFSSVSRVAVWEPVSAVESVDRWVAS